MNALPACPLWLQKKIKCRVTNKIELSPNYYSITGMIFMTRSGRYNPPAISFKADHPFVYAIVEKSPQSDLNTIFQGRFSKQ